VFQKFVGILPGRAEVPPPARQMIDQRRVGNGGIQVVLNGDDGDALFFVYSFQETVDLFLAAHVHAGRGFVQNQQIRISHQCPRDQYFLALSAGEGAHQRARKARHPDLLEIFRDYVFVFDLQQSAVGVQRLIDRNGKIGVGEIASLREISDPSCPRHDASARGFHEFQYQPHQRGLPAAVLSHDRHVFAVMYFQIDAAQHIRRRARIGKE
jgi:hypothetical protein